MTRSSAVRGGGSARVPTYRVFFPGHKYREIILDSGGNGGNGGTGSNGGTGGTGGGLWGLALMPAICPPLLKIAALSREDLPKEAKLPDPSKSHRIFVPFLEKTSAT